MPATPECRAERKAGRREANLGRKQGPHVHAGELKEASTCHLRGGNAKEQHRHNLLIPSPHPLVLAISERFLKAGGTFRVILASESHWLQSVLVLSVCWWPAPACVGRV
jgi:hypothetical protein